MNAQSNTQTAPWISFLTQRETLGGLLLIVATAISLIMTNTGLHGLYHDTIDMPVTIMFGELGLQKPLHLWINDGLMAIFFFAVGLEIKREIIEGGLSTPKRALLPVLAAIGGMAVPVAIFYAFNHDQPASLPGWAIPSATDIAFALGVLSLLGPRVPPALKVLLLAIAVIDDLGAIIIIALFYTQTLAPTALMIAALCLLTLFVMNRLGVLRTSAYLVISFIMWASVLKSGVHATLAGVAAAFFIPTVHMKNMEHALHPWVAFAIMPAFAFANAGVSLHGVNIEQLLTPLAGGIMAGLAIGKPLGIFGTLFIAIRSGLTPMPAGVAWSQLFGLSLLCGIGFTMSLFIGTLAFPPGDLLKDVRLGVMSGSLVSIILGYIVLRRSLSSQKETHYVT